MVAIGDTALTTSGFYGVIIDITDDDVIVEFAVNAEEPAEPDAEIKIVFRSKKSFLEQNKQTD